VAQKENFYIWRCLLYLRAGNLRHFKFGMWFEHSTSQPTDDKLSLKGAWSLSRDLFNFWKMSDNISKTVQDGAPIISL